MPIERPAKQWKFIEMPFSLLEKLHLWDNLNHNWNLWATMSLTIPQSSLQYSSSIDFRHFYGTHIRLVSRINIWPTILSTNSKAWAFNTSVSDCCSEIIFIWFLEILYIEMLGCLGTNEATEWVQTIVHITWDGSMKHLKWCKEPHKRSTLAYCTFINAPGIQESEI